MVNPDFRDDPGRNLAADPASTKIRKILTPTRFTPDIRSFLTRMRP
jgi:hypothetical protein